MSKPAKPRRIDQYKVGDELFRYVDAGGVFRYIVTGVRSYADEVQLEAECQTCSHGYKCKVLLARDDEHRIVTVHMLNEDENDRQRYWHSNDGMFFWPTENEARMDGYAFLMRRRETNVREAEDRLKAAIKSRDELAALMKKNEATP